MAAILYAEVYLICIIILGILLFFAKRNGQNSAPEQWLIRVLLCFLINFLSNFAFTVVTRVIQQSGFTYMLGFMFKSLYHLSLIIGVYIWCIYAEVEQKTKILSNKKFLTYMAVPLLLPILFALSNPWTHKLFYLTAEGGYKRDLLFHFQMVFLFAVSGISAVRLLQHASREPDPLKRSHFQLTATFPLCILAAWILSFIGESVPVICVAITIEMLCLFIGTSTQQISLDKLTQVNNRQNLMGFMDYKLKNHSGPLYLLLIDVDYFKQINDTYGHLEGDNALVKVSSTLKEACGPIKQRPYIARYGGDEFVVVTQAQSPEEVDSLKAAIRSKLSELGEGLPYKLLLSIGVAQWQEGQSAKDLIAAADAGLYEVKRARNSKISRNAN